jgi:ABC transporter
VRLLPPLGPRLTRARASFGPSRQVTCVAMKSSALPIASIWGRSWRERRSPVGTDLRLTHHAGRAENDRFRSSAIFRALAGFALLRVAAKHELLCIRSMTQSLVSGAAASAIEPSSRQCRGQPRRRAPDRGWRSTLSGRQKQRVVLARALVRRPRVQAFDEPLGASSALWMPCAFQAAAGGAGAARPPFCDARRRRSGDLRRPCADDRGRRNRARPFGRMAAAAHPRRRRGGGA